MKNFYLVYEDEGLRFLSPTMHATLRDALLEALHRLGDDMEEAVTMDEDSLEERLARLNGKSTDFQACIVEGSREELEALFAGTTLGIARDIEPSGSGTPGP